MENTHNTDIINDKNNATCIDQAASVLLAEKDKTIAALTEKLASFEQQLEWFKRQVFGEKSEKRDMADNLYQTTIADVSFLVGMLVDKFLYHLPLYRQHQR